MGLLVLSILAVLVIGSLFRRLWALTLAMLMYPLEQSLQGSVDQFRAFPPLANYIVAAVVGLAAIRAALAMQRPFFGYFTRGWFVTVGIFAWSAVSLIWTPSMPQAGDLVREGLPYFILFVLTAPILIDGVDDLLELSSLIMVFGGLVALTIIINPEFNLKSGRLGLMLTSTVRSSPLAIGELGGTLLIVSSLFRSPAAGAVLKLARPVAFVCGAALALYSGSRGQLLFGAAFALAFYPVARPVRSIASYAATAVGVVLVGGTLVLLSQLLLEGDMLRRWQGDLLSAGVEVRQLNTLDLFRAFAANPVAWIFGLGWNAFSSITDASTEPYSHSLMVDLLAELGLPALIAFMIFAVDVVRGSTSLFREWSSDEQRRAAITVIMALALYQFLLVNKQGYLWGAGLSFLHWLIIVRVRARTGTAGALTDG
jgi:hypothetical protein